MDAGGIWRGSGDFCGMPGHVSGGNAENAAGDEQEDSSGSGDSVCDIGHRGRETGGGAGLFFQGNGELNGL